jgi:hypothetical protein
MQVGVTLHVHAFVAHRMAQANTGTTEEVLAAFFHGREDIIPDMFRQLLKPLYGVKHERGLVRHGCRT